jgi:RES domain-containing protein
MFAGASPDRENFRGARWNPSGVGAIYTSLTRETALAEAEYRITLEPIAMRRDLKRTIHEINIVLHAVIDLNSHERLQKLGVDKTVLSGTDLSPCQRVGGQVDWFEHDGLLVPSARHEGVNLVIYPSNRRANSVFSVVQSIDINP